MHVGMAIPSEASPQFRREHARHFAAIERRLEERAVVAAVLAIPVKTIAGSSDPAHVIATTVLDENINLLVLGTHSHHRWEEIVAGSVAEQRAPGALYCHHRQAVADVHGCRRLTSCSVRPTGIPLA